MRQVCVPTAARLPRPWSRRTSLGTDLAAGLLLCMIEVAVCAGKLFADGMEVWAAQGDQARIDEARLGDTTWLEYFLAATVLLVVIAALSRAPWTVALQLLAAIVVAVLLGSAHHSHDQTDHRPPPAPNYTPCYSGSGRCH
ncbi:DUF6234 family protein [Streptomyces sp. NPDC048111]|uniref:DUF6234 family protein n=1 Tax=Streptomyces sp. NPDC048111 TaxID=3365500 RepID=UPI00371717B0